MAPDNLPDFSDVRSGRATRPADAAAVEAPRTYEVKQGDSLSKIAKKVYGHANQWTRIFEANRDIITNPDLIKPGQVLKLPE